MRLIAPLIAALGLLSTLVACGGRQSSVPVMHDYTSRDSGRFRVTPQSLCYKDGNYYKCGGGSGGSGGNPSCTLMLTDVDTEPQPQNRTTIGVGEQVQISSNGSNMIIATPTGTTDHLSSSRTPATITAGDLTDVNTPGTIDVAVYGLGTKGCQETDLTVTVIAPSQAYYFGDGLLRHTQGLADIGFNSNVYLYPDSVSFAAVSEQEGSAMTTATNPGDWWCQSGPLTPAPGQPMTTTVVPGRGTLLSRTDNAYSGSCPGNQFQNSVETAPIPTQYSLVGNWRTFGPTITQQATGNTAGALTLSKDHNSATSAVNNPTSSYPGQ